MPMLGKQRRNEETAALALASRGNDKHMAFLLALSELNGQAPPIPNEQEGLRCVVALPEGSAVRDFLPCEVGLPQLRKGGPMSTTMGGTRAAWAQHQQRSRKQEERYKKLDVQGLQRDRWLRVKKVMHLHVKVPHQPCDEDKGGHDKDQPGEDGMVILPLECARLEGLHEG